MVAAFVRTEDPPMTTRPNRSDPLGQLVGKVAITLLVLALLIKFWEFLVWTALLGFAIYCLKTWWQI